MIRITMKVDRRQLQAKLRRAAQASPAARRAALVIVGSYVSQEVVATAPRDTNRYVRGWAMAAKQAGLGPLPVPALAASSQREQILTALARQLRRWNRIVASYEAKGRRDRWYRQALRKRDRAAEHARRYAGTDHGIVINLFRSARWEGGMATVRDKVYGGRGRIIGVGGRTYVELHNLEPHTTLVERRFNVMARAQKKFRGVGLHRAGRRYIAEVQRRSGFAAGSA